MIHTKELDAFTRRFAECPLEPLRVTFHLRPGGRVVNYDPIHLDGLLARAVVAIATEGRLLADQEKGYWIPLPLKMLWRSPEGYPLWAASTLYPVGPAEQDTYVRHKRNSEGWMHKKKKLVTRSGPWMERRLPTPIEVCDRYEGRCVGNREAVKNLLEDFSHLGKLRLGRIDRVEVEPADFEGTDTYLDGTTLIRPLPAEAGLLKMWPGKPSLVGWTPPFWKPSLFRPGWRAGTRGEVVDWFAATEDLSA